MLHSANNQPAFHTLNVDVLLVSVTDVEVEAALSVLETHLGRRAELRVLGDKTYFDLGMVGQAYTCLIRTEMGSGGVGGSLLAIEASIQALAPAAIIMLGIAFGVDRKRQRLGDILIAQQLLLYDLQRLSSGTAGEVVARLRGDRPSASIRQQPTGSANMGYAGRAGLSADQLAWRESGRQLDQYRLPG